MENTLFKPRIMKKSTVCSRTPNKSVMACQLQDRRMVIKTDGSDGVLCARHEKSVTVNRLIQGQIGSPPRAGRPFGEKRTGTNTQARAFWGRAAGRSGGLRGAKVTFSGRYPDIHCAPTKQPGTSLFPSAMAAQPGACPETSLPAAPLQTSGSFPMSQFFAAGGQRIGVSASASVLPVNIQD